MSEDRLQQALKEQKKAGKTLLQTLVGQGVIKEKDALGLLSRRLGIPLANLSSETVDVSVSSKIPPKIAYRCKAVPLKQEGNSLTLAVSDPLDVNALDDIRLLTGCELKPVLCSEREILKTLKSVYGVGAETMETLLASDTPVPAAGAIEGPEGLETEAEDASIVSFVNWGIGRSNGRSTDSLASRTPGQGSCSWLREHIMAGGSRT